MGFDIYIESDPEYSVHFSMWEWDRILDIFLWSKKIYTLPELQSRLTASNMKETSSKAEGAGQDMTDFDLKEWEKRVRLESKSDDSERATMHVGGYREKSGRFIFNSMTCSLGTELDKKSVKTLTRQAAVSLSHFQGLEDKMFDNKETAEGFYGMHTNEFDISYETCWELYDILLSLFNEMPDICRSLGEAPIIIGDRLPSVGRTFFDEIAEEYLGVETMVKFARLMGILINGIMSPDKSPVVIR
jgi:hypothetical protein